MKLELTETEAIYIYKLLNRVKLFASYLLEDYETPNTDADEIIDITIARLNKLITNDY